MNNIIFMPREFLSTLSLRRATTKTKTDEDRYKFLSTLSLRRATVKKSITFYPPVISIHALLAESDGFATIIIICIARFLSTLSLRRATHCAIILRRVNLDFYPRSPCGERHSSPLYISTMSKISIHALLAESDGFKRCKKRPRCDFYPRSPCGERPDFGRVLYCLRTFLSTLSLRRATISRYTARPLSSYFYPRSPCGERQCLLKSTLVRSKFLSTLSLRRATRQVYSVSCYLAISIHALLAESDKRDRDAESDALHFYPRSPCGERPRSPSHSSGCCHFYPRSPCGERPQ